MRDMEIFKKLVENEIKDLSFNEMILYNEIGVVCSFLVEGM
jgi:hypothetical protein